MRIAIAQGPNSDDIAVKLDNNFGELYAAKASATKEIWIDVNRTDDYTPDGSIGNPYKSFSTRLPKGTAGQTLKMNAGATAPVWV